MTDTRTNSQARENGTPLVSCLCVTENRAAFMPWLLWNFDKQSWPRRELIIVDSSPQPYVAEERDDVRVIPVAVGANVPAKRNRALGAARGQIITWFDDDDWQHPNKVTWLVEALQQGAVYAGTTQSWFVNLATQRVTPYRAAGKQVIFNSAGFRREAVMQFHFPEDVYRASDSRWMQQLQRRHSGRVAHVPRQAIFFWLSHTDNLSNPASKRRGTHSLEMLRQIVAQAWSDTDAQLAALRTRLDQPEPPPAPRQSVVSAPVHSSGPAKVSACLLSWKRPHNMQLIVDSLRRHDFIDEIIVWNNNPACTLPLRGDNVRVIDSPRNEICYGRYLCAREARNPIIYTQDDDVIVENVTSLWQHFLRDDSCITHALSAQHMRQRNRCIYAQGHNALLGWGSFLRKEWLAPLESYVEQHGCDHVMRWGADKIFTILLGRTHNTFSASLRTLDDSTVQGIAMYRDPAHMRLNALAVRRALAAVRERQSVAYPVTWNVVITSYNYGRFLGDAVESVLDNDADYVITIVDDASTDETEAIGRCYTDEYEQIRYIRLPVNRGTSHARNCGVAAVDSLFVVLLDADDRIGRNYLYEAEKLLRTGCDVANPDAILFGKRRARWPVPEQVTVQMLRQRNHVHCASAFRRSYWVQVGGIAEEMTHWMDYDFWLRLAKAGARIQRVTGDHFYYRKHGASKSTESAAKRTELMQMIQQRHG